MRRLTLATVGDLPYERGPVVELHTSPADARAVLDDQRSEWLGLTDGERFLGWVDGTEVVDGAHLDDLHRFLPAAQVAPSSTLRNAMEVIMNSRTSVAVINDDDRFCGVVTLERIREGLAGDLSATAGPQG